MAEAARESGLTAMINYESRFASSQAQVAELVAEGAIGRVQHVNIDMQSSNPLLAMDRAWRLDPAHGGGLLNELGSHVIDRVRLWFGEIASVSAQLYSFPPEGLDAQFTSEDAISASFEMANGIVVTLAMSWVSDPPLGLRIVIAGSEGVILATTSGSVLSTVELSLGRKGEDELRVVDPPDQVVEAGGAVALSAKLIEAFAEGIDAGASPSPNFEDALRSQLVMDAMRASASGGGSVVAVAGLHAD